jgi:hypothetical protein
MNANSVTRGHVFKLLTSNCHVDANKWFFDQRMVNVWNSLPACIAVNFASLAAFKTFITKTDLSTYLQCSVGNGVC